MGVHEIQLHIVNLKLFILFLGRRNHVTILRNQKSSGKFVIFYENDYKGSAFFLFTACSAFLLFPAPWNNFIK